MRRKKKVKEIPIDRVGKRRRRATLKESRWCLMYDIYHFCSILWFLLVFFNLSLLLSCHCFWLTKSVIQFSFCRYDASQILFVSLPQNSIPKLHWNLTEISLCELQKTLIRSKMLSPFRRFYFRIPLKMYIYNIRVIF